MLAEAAFIEASYAFRLAHGEGLQTQDPDASAAAENWGGPSVICLLRRQLVLLYTEEARVVLEH